MSRQRRKQQAAGPDGAGTVPGRRVSRRTFIGGALGGAVLLAWGWRIRGRRRPGAGAGTVVVYKSVTCECCGKWIEHMQANGFTLQARDLADIVAPKRNLGVPAELYSCHTSDVGGYVFEGHVPADLVARVLRERPAIRGLAVPGMPASAPGMDLGRQPYEVVAFTRTGESFVYAERSS